MSLPLSVFRLLVVIKLAPLLHSFLQYRNKGENLIRILFFKKKEKVQKKFQEKVIRKVHGFKSWNFMTLLWYKGMLPSFILRHILRALTF